MANTSKLNPEILKFLSAKRQKSIPTIRSQISVLKRSSPQSTLNAIAQVYAQKHGLSVLRFLSKQDKLTIPQVRIDNTHVLKLKRRKSTERMKEVFRLETQDNFVKKHVAEINRAYTKRCYTCVFLLARKVFENLVIEILRAKFPAAPELCYDQHRGRNHDFKDILDNLYKHRVDFGPEKKKAIERLHPKLKPFKDDANDKAHSLFHIVENEKEIDDWHLDTLIDLIVTIRKGL
jgi:hypothetical protein